MKELTVKKLAEIIGAESAGTADGKLVGGVCIDSRTIKKGDCFFAVSGENFDGHDYVGQAFQKGASCAVVNRSADNGQALLRVDDTIDALGLLAKDRRRRGGFKVVGITGSVGKTTTRQILFHVLRNCWRVHTSPKNFNNKIGLPLTLLGADAEQQIVVVELGSSFPGEIAYLSRIAEPDIAVVTNAFAAHLAGFGDVEAVRREKLSIGDGLNDGGELIVNGDSEGLVEMCRSEGRGVTTFGLSGDCDVRAKDIRFDGFCSEFSIDEVKIEIALPGRGNIANVLAAWAVCRRFGMDIEDFAKSVKSAEAVSMRAEVMEIGGLMILNDCYNACPASMRNALEIAAKIKEERGGRLVFICGDMAELGEQEQKLHVELGERIAEAGVDMLLAVGRLAGVAGKSAEKELEVRYFEDSFSACNSVAKLIKNGDIIVVKGSRSAGLEMVTEKLKAVFGER